MVSSLPLGLNQIEIQRGLTSSGVAIFVPFTTQELFQGHEGALYYGINALSNNLIMVDRKKLKNPNGLIKNPLPRSLSRILETFFRKQRIYGCRLGLFLLIREMKNAAYKKTLDAQTKPVPIFVKVVMWLMMALLYPMQVSPVMYRLVNGGTSDVCAWIGAGITLIGVVMEAVADKQKSAAKKKNPSMVAMDGLFKLCRCPNYFGEILVWTGCFVSGLSILKGWQWAVAVFGYVCIVYIMFSGAKRLETRQNKNYGDKQEYRDYANKTPILIPFVPLYHLVKEK